MPELPEVETVKRTLEKNYVGRKIEKVEILLPRMILSSLDEFKNNLTNVIISSIKRKGKYLIFNLSNDYSFISHLRMEGKYILRNNDEPIINHTRVIFYLDNNEKLCYDDSRSFGIMKMAKSEDIYSLEELKKLGPEPFEINDSSYLINKFSKLKCEIKQALLDQTIMCGIGNIYCDEILFKSKINPFRKASSLNKEECEKILQYSKLTLTKAIELGGSTISSYHPSKGVDGKFQNELFVYGRANKECLTCHHLLLKDRIGGRGTTYCPFCQNVCINVGISGKIASGKSYALKYFKEKGYKVYSCDEDINYIYSLDSTKISLIKIFGEQVINDNGTVAKGYIKNNMINNPSLKEEIENLIHPICKEHILKFIKENKEEKLIFIEVPLMFETGFYKMFDKLIGISCSTITQINHLKIRKSSNVTKDLLLNKNTAFDKNVDKCDYLINNDGSLEEYEAKLDEILKNMLQ